MRWADVDLTTAWWLLLGTATKNATDHRVPLSAPVVKLLKTRRAQAAEDAVYVFPGRKTATSVAARAKKAASSLSRGLPFTFRAHDLRRTAASGMGAAGVPREHIAHVLNHRSVTFSTVTAIYDRYHYDAEKRAALDRWASVLLATVSGKRRRQAPVLAFTGRAGV
jgi:integrase